MPNRLKLSQAVHNRLDEVSLPNISIRGMAFQDSAVLRLYFFPVDPQFALDRLKIRIVLLQQLPHRIIIIQRLLGGEKEPHWKMQIIYPKLILKGKWKRFCFRKIQFTDRWDWRKQIVAFFQFLLFDSVIRGRCLLFSLLQRRRVFCDIGGFYACLASAQQYRYYQSTTKHF